MACVVKLREISHYKSIESIDNNPYKKFIDAKSKQNCQLSTRLLPKINGFGITTKTIITESKTDLIFDILLKQRGELSVLPFRK